jgi:hypothetical protein
VYGSVLSTLSDEIILLIRPRELALELCRLTNIGRPAATLETACILSLPVLAMSASLRWATCFGEHPGHALFSKSRRPPTSDSVGAPVFPFTFMSTRHPPWVPRQQLQPVPADGIISVVMNFLYKPSGHFRTIDLCVRCRTLLAFTNNKPAQAGAGGEGEGEGAVPTVPWGEWGPKNTRVLEHNPHMSGSLVGERRATVEQVRARSITMRDYNPFRVRQALARTGGAGKEIELECGSVMKVVDETSVYPKGDWFDADIESSLPYVETVTPYPGCEDIFMDEVNLVAEVRTEVRSSLVTFDGWPADLSNRPFQAGDRKFHLHRL